MSAAASFSSAASLRDAIFFVSSGAGAVALIPRTAHRPARPKTACAGGKKEAFFPVAGGESRSERRDGVFPDRDRPGEFRRSDHGDPGQFIHQKLQ